MLRSVILALALISQAIAEPPDALAAYLSGEYAEAAVLAEAAGQADGMALAARAVLADAMVLTDAEPAEETLKRAEALARAALAEDETHSEARLQLAIALSLQARGMSLRAARRSGYGELARGLADAVAADEPQNAYAHGFLAVWHVEVLRRGGRIGAMVMGASVKQARAHYQMAVAARADDCALHWQWARVLAATNARRFRPEIEAALAAAVRSPADDRLERVMQGRALLLQDALETRTRGDVERLAASLL